MLGQIQHPNTANITKHFNPAQVFEFNMSANYNDLY